jgi:hypothetical protein
MESLDVKEIENSSSSKQMIGWNKGFPGRITAIFVEEIEIFTFLVSQNFGSSNSSQVDPNSWYCRENGNRWISIATGQHGTTNRLTESKSQPQWNEPSAFETARIDQGTFDRVPAKICSPWI